MLTFLKDHGLVLVFAVVFAEQIGIPLPALPLLIAAGVLAGAEHLNIVAVAAMAMGAALAADLIWYELGRRRGHRVLEFLCRIALEPRSCIMRTEEFFKKHGVRSLIVAKFVPGLSTVAPPLAGIAALPFSRFLFYNGLGIVLWVGSGIGFGYAFSDRIDAAMEYASFMTPATIAVLAAALSVYLAGKALRRRIELRRVPQVSADELRAKLEGHDAPVLIDVRAQSVTARDGAIPGALAIPADEISDRYRELPSNRDIVAYCACPGDVASATVVRFLHAQGLVRAKVLKGGVEAWRAGRRMPMNARLPGIPIGEPSQPLAIDNGDLNRERRDDVDGSAGSVSGEIDSSLVRETEEVPC
ncbi:MAG TPA: VTT domain-containing protein [Nitrospiraceae bacterium]|nr:VTT domain-containing protein [Nitrospiraceae bacterium]